MFLVFNLNYCSNDLILRYTLYLHYDFLLILANVNVTKFLMVFLLKQAFRSKCETIEIL